jgi:hypothetical protein
MPIFNDNPISTDHIRPSCRVVAPAPQVRARAGTAATLAVALAALLPSAGNAATVIGGSDLLVGGGLTQVESWLVNDSQLSYAGPLQFTNIFDKAPGNTSTHFHAAADGNGATVVLMEARVMGSTGPWQIIGGFNPQSWSGLGYNLTVPLADRTAFIFNLTTTDRRDQAADASYGVYQTYNNGSYGPTFGGGHDIYVPYGLSWYGYLRSYGYCVNGDTNTTGCAGAVNLLGLTDYSSIEIGRLEVFTIAEVGNVPVPAALPLFATVLAGGGLVAWRRKRNTAKVATA